MPFILPANSLTGGYDVANSLRFNDGSDDTLTRTVSSASNRRTFTYSGWIKRGILGTGMGLFGQGDYSSSTGSDHFNIRLEGDDNIRIEPSGFDIKTNRLFRDPSAFYHIVLAVDTTQGTASNRVKLYVNGVQETSFANTTYPDENEDTQVNTAGDTGTVYLGDVFNATGKFDGYMSEVCFIDGLALAADSFGEFDEDSGTWKPIDVSGLTFGTNGFYLEFKQAGTSANASGLGADTSGNTHHFTVNNLTAVDQSTDTCTNNFATMNPLDTNSNHTFSEGNLKTVYSAAAGTFGVTKGTIGVSAGKWYWEIKYTYGNAGQFGVFDVNDLDTLNTTDIFSAAGNSTFEGLAWRIDTSNNIKEVGVGQSADSGLDFTSGAILGIAFDADNGKFYGFKNGAEITGQDIGAGTSLLTAVTVSDFYLPFVSNGDGGSGTKTGTSEFNFGSPPFAISSSNADAKGHGNFEYTVPSGYFALCTKNLEEFG